MITLREKVQVYEQLLHNIHFSRSVLMNEERVIEALNAITTWSNAHSDSNGERSDREIKRNINSAFEKLKDI